MDCSTLSATLVYRMSNSNLRGRPNISSAPTKKVDKLSDFLFRERFKIHICPDGGNNTVFKSQVTANLDLSNVMTGRQSTPRLRDRRARIVHNSAQTHRSSWGAYLERKTRRFVLVPALSCATRPPLPCVKTSDRHHKATRTAVRLLCVCLTSSVYTVQAECALCKTSCK